MHLAIHAKGLSHGIDLIVPRGPNYERAERRTGFHVNEVLLESHAGSITTYFYE